MWKYFLLVLLCIVLFILKYKLTLQYESFNSPKVYHIYYINLKHREDRKEELLKQLKKLDTLNNTKFVIERIDAVKHVKGGIGCGESHIKALKKATYNNLNQVIIMEDDIDIKLKEINNYFKKIQNNLNWDVFIMSGHGHKKKINDTINQVLNVQTTGMYIIKNHYYEKLQNCFQESVDNMKRRYEKGKDIKYSKWAIDQNWKKLQQQDTWLTLNTNLGFQREDYSDIENKKVNYDSSLK